MELDLAHIVEAVVAIGGIVMAVLNHFGKKEEAAKVEAVVKGVEDAARVMGSDNARALKRKIQAAATTVGIQEALHATVKEITEKRG